MDYQRQKEITRICYEEGKLTKEQYEKEIEKIDRMLREQAKRLVAELLGKI